MMMMVFGARLTPKQRLALRRQDVWRRDLQRRKRPLPGGRKCFSYRLVCISSAILTSYYRCHSFSVIFIHFHSCSYFELFSNALFQARLKSINQRSASETRTLIDWLIDTWGNGFFKVAVFQLWSDGVLIRMGTRRVSTVVEYRRICHVVESCIFV